MSQEGRGKKDRNTGCHWISLQLCDGSVVSDSSTSHTKSRQTISKKASGMTNSKQIPAAFICPLTLNVMEDPLMTKEGHSYERSAILKWVSENNTSPLTREPLTMSQLIRNHALKSEIESWRKFHGEAGSATDSESQDGLSEFDNDDDEVEGDDPMFVFLPPDVMDELCQRAHSATNASEAQNENEEDTEAGVVLNEEQRSTSDRNRSTGRNNNQCKRRLHWARQSLFGRQSRRPSASPDR